MRKLILLASVAVVFCSANIASSYTVSHNYSQDLSLVTKLSYSVDSGQSGGIDIEKNFKIVSEHGNVGPLSVDLIFYVDLEAIGGESMGGEEGIWPDSSDASIFWGYKESGGQYFEELCSHYIESQYDPSSFTGSISASDVLLMIGIEYTLTGQLQLTAGESIGSAGGESYLSNIILPDETNSNPINPASVPIPGAGWLLGAGLVGLVGLRRKIKN